MSTFMEKWNNELVESGEFVDARGLAEPVHTRRVGLQNGVRVVTDGPYAETQEVLAGYTIVECDSFLRADPQQTVFQEVLAGYTIVDCESFDRATEIADKLADCPPGPGNPQNLYVDIRPIADGPGEFEGRPPGHRRLG